MNSNSTGSQFKQIDYYSSVLSAYFEATPASTLNAIENIQHTEWKTIESLIDNEIELKKFELLKEPFLLFMIPIIGFLFKELFSRASDLWFTVIFIGILLMTLFGAQLILAFRNRENKMKELKLFVQWYQELGQDIKE